MSAVTGHAQGRPPAHSSLEVRTRVGGDDARVPEHLGQVHRADRGVSVRAANERKVQSTGHLQVVDEARLAGQQRRVLAPDPSRSDDAGPLARPFSAGAAGAASAGLSTVVIALGPTSSARACAPPPAPPGRCCGSRCSGTGCPSSPTRTSSSVGSGFSVRSDDDGHHHARRAVAALQAVVLLERLLDRMHRPSASASPSIVVTSSPSACTASTVQDFTDSPSMQDGAGAARRGVTADVRPGQAEHVAQIVHEQTCAARRRASRSSR